MDGWMDHLAREQNAALVIIGFLQADCCKSSELDSELRSLRNELHQRWDTEAEGSDDGDIECDGHSNFPIGASLGDIRPSVELDHHAAEAIQDVVLGLRVIADQLNQDVVARAAHNLQRSIETCPPNQWGHVFRREVRSAMQGVGLENHPQERVVVALSLTLVRGVCKHTPRLLRSLFRTALEYISDP